MRAWSDARSFRRNDLLKLSAEVATSAGSKPDELHQKILQRLGRRVASAETIADAEGAHELRAEARPGRPEHG